MEMKSSNLSHFDFRCIASNLSLNRIHAISSSSSHRIGTIFFLKNHISFLPELPDPLLFNFIEKKRCDLRCIVVEMEQEQGDTYRRRFVPHQVCSQLFPTVVEDSDFSSIERAQDRVDKIIPEQGRQIALRDVD